MKDTPQDVFLDVFPSLMLFESDQLLAFKSGLLTGVKLVKLLAEHDGEEHFDALFRLLYGSEYEIVPPDRLVEMMRRYFPDGATWLTTEFIVNPNRCDPTYRQGFFESKLLMKVWEYYNYWYVYEHAIQYFDEYLSNFCMRARLF